MYSLKKKTYFLGPADDLIGGNSLHVWMKVCCCCIILS